MKVGDKLIGFKFNGDDYSCGYSDEFMDEFIGVEGVIVSIDNGIAEVSFPKRVATWFYPIEIKKTDPIVESVINQFKTRSNIGIKKYGTTLERKDVDVLGWLNHLQQELQDATLYIERLKQEYDNK